MENLELYLKNLTGKDENLAQKAADFLINSADVKLFELLVNKSDFLFDFVRNNVEKRIKNAINSKNYKNILKFFDCYSDYYDDLFAEILSEHANEDLTDEIFEFLEKGNISQKTYAAKYFAYIPDTVALEPLSKYAFDNDENLAYNSAQALGQMQDDISYDIALNLLYSEDDFEKLKAVRFFCAYANNYPLKDIFNAMKKSKMPENIAGQIPYMISLVHLLNSEFKEDAIDVIDNIIVGLGEILPLSDIFQFELYDVINFLINSTDSNYEGKTAKILLNVYSKFTMFSENQEYIFDENKNTKQEISSIYKLLKSRNDEFWNKQKELILKELSSNDDTRILSSLGVVSEYKLVNAIPLLKNILTSNNEILLCECLNTLKSLNALDDIDINMYCDKVKNPNIKAVIQSLKE